MSIGKYALLMTKPTPRKNRLPIFRALLMWSAIGVGLGLLVLVSLAQMAAGRWVWEGLELDSSKWFDVSRSTITTVGIFGLGGAALLAYRRQDTTEQQHVLDDRKQEAADKADLRARYTTAADQLGHDKPAVRLAGVYAMAALANDWHAAGDIEQRQVCIDVLCAYLRMPYDPQSDRAKTGEKEVRLTVINVINSNLQEPSSGSSWCGTNLDLTGVVFDGGNFNRAQFTGGTVNFTKAKFSSGGVTFDGARFTGGSVHFDEAQFTGGKVSFYEGQFTGGKVSFYQALFTGGEVDFSQAEFNGAKINFTRAVLEGGNVNFFAATFASGHVGFYEAKFAGTNFTFIMAKFTGGSVTFYKGKFTKGHVGFFNAEFSGGNVSFDESQLSGGEVAFDAAQFTDGKVSFSKARFSGTSVSFQKASGSIPAVLSFDDVNEWTHSPEVPWGQGTSPVWVRPTLWPPAT